VSTGLADGTGAVLISNLLARMFERPAHGKKPHTKR
jgi:hypothetical protein